jgi:hypothetical protein
MDPVQIDTLKKKIEADAMAKVAELRNCPPIKVKSIPAAQKIQEEQQLVAIMQNGADEFKAKTGRNMTYSEMREMYG